MAVSGRIQEGFWVGFGLALAFAAFGFLQILFRRAEGN